MPSNGLSLTVNASGYTNNLWTNPTNAVGSTGSYATVAPGNTSSRSLTVDTNVTSVLPADAVIKGVVINVKYKVSTTSFSPAMECGPSNGTNTPISSEPPITPTTSDVVYSFGSSTNPMNVTTRSQLVTMSMRVYQNTSGSLTHYIDDCNMTVYWDYPAAGNVLFFGENF